MRTELQMFAVLVPFNFLGTGGVPPHREGRYLYYHRVLFLS